MSISKIKIPWKVNKFQAYNKIFLNHQFGHVLKIKKVLKNNKIVILKKHKICVNNQNNNKSFIEHINKKKMSYKKFYKQINQILVLFPQKSKEADFCHNNLIAKNNKQKFNWTNKSCLIINFKAIRHHKDAHLCSA